MQRPSTAFLLIILGLSGLVLATAIMLQAMLYRHDRLHLLEQVNGGLARESAELIQKQIDSGVSLRTASRVLARVAHLDNRSGLISMLAVTGPDGERVFYFDDHPPPSLLQVPGANDIAVEFTSMSKTYSMAGWRVGFAVGNKKLIAALTRVKSYLDYGAFTPIQAAACAALNGPQDIVEMNRNLYQKRRDVMVEAFGRAGWDIPSPKASMFAWAPLPPALREMGSLEFSKQLLTHAEVAVAPGVGYGEDGEGFVRIAMVENEQRLRQAARNIKRYLASMGVNSSAA